jgi:hypothetical protein
MKKFSEFNLNEEEYLEEKPRWEWKSSFESKKELVKLAKGLVKDVNAVSIPDPSDSSFRGDNKRYAQAEHQMMIELDKVKREIEGTVKHLGTIGKFK